jgi:hypothetical protein
MSEVHELKDSKNHRVAHGYQGVKTTYRNPIDDVLYEINHSSQPSSLRPACLKIIDTLRQVLILYQGNSCMETQAGQRPSHKNLDFWQAQQLVV